MHIQYTGIHAFLNLFSFSVTCCSLYVAIDHLRSILEEKYQQEQEIDSLKKEVLALQIMKA
jgi:hypothetical protein